ncbi:MAG: hypothetical protein ACREU7_16775 [Burkholderiales bacterium]
MIRLTAVLAGAIALTASGVSSAHPLTLEECAQGGEFIRHAAMSRDAGVTKQIFMNRFAEDIALIQAFPPELRWFVQDEHDERLLGSAAEQVFDQPMKPEQHEAAFVSDCIQTTAWRNAGEQ